MNKPYINYFPNVGFVTVKLTDEQLAPVWAEVNQIKNGTKQARAINQHLAGNLEREYELTDCTQYIEQLVMPYLGMYEKEFKVIEYISVLDVARPIFLDGAWVNFQKKHEFNPMHNHSGVFSFVIWLDIPYSIEDENSAPGSRNALLQVPGNFYFVALNSIGQIIQKNIPVDRTYNGTLCIFPSSMNHGVHPFTTSDDYRITVSGNFKFSTKETYDAPTN